MHLSLILLVGAARLVAGLPPTQPHQFPRRATNSAPTLAWELFTTGSAQRFRGLSPVSPEIAWVAGTNGTVLRTVDSGRTWDSIGPALAPEDAELQFRDIEAWSADSAVALSIGESNASRIYTTNDGGQTWATPFVNDDAAAFYDCLAFENLEHGLAMSDPVDGKFRLLETLDGGQTWDVVDPSGMPDALEGEAGFAASGTCLATAAGRWYLASGGVNPGRIYRSADAGHTWDVSNSSITGGASAGVFSVAFRDARHGIAVGGDYVSPNITTKISAWSHDGGVTWLPSVKYPGGYRSGASWVPGLCGMAVAVGPTGSDITLDGGNTWNGFGNGSFDSVECISGQVCWASGEAGRVARLTL
ncbi:putative Oxidoreductase [Seiridium cardinale]